MVDVLPSRELVIDQLIRECLDFPPGRLRDLPVIVMMGTRGSEKTDLLEEVQRRCSGVRPCAFRDLEVTVAGPAEIAAHIADGLSRPVRQFGELTFPRLLLGMIVIRTERARDRTDLAHLLDDERWLIDQAREVGERIQGDTAIHSGTGKVLGLPVEKAAARRTVRALRRQGLPWYREGTGQRFPTPLDGLAAVCSSAVVASRRPRTEAEAWSVPDHEEALCAALLADLRANFTGVINSRRRTGNCVALLDNADTAEGESFLRALVTARQATRSRAGCDPLLVIAARHSRYPASARHSRPSAAGDQGARELPPRPPQRARYADWESGRDGTTSSWLYSVRLGDVDDRDLAAVLRDHPDAVAVPGAVRFAERLTGGHPAGLRLVLRALAARASRAGPQNVDLREVLDMPDPSAPERTVAETVLDATLRSGLGVLRQDLTTCAAAADVETASRRQALGVAAGGGGTLDQFCATDLWVESTGEPPRRVLLPFLRRVLLHALANRSDDSTDSWDAVHGRLREYYLNERHNEPAALYHALALGDIEAAVSHLDPQLNRVDTRQWLADLKAIVRAPRRTKQSSAAPRDQVAGLADDGGTLAHLTAALWISSDPLGDPHGSLGVLIAADLDRLAPRSRDPTVLLDEANAYRVRDQNWREL